MIDALLSPKLLLLYAWVTSAAYVHFRGRVRLRVTRQIYDHSTYTALYNALVYLFSPDRRGRFFRVRDFPELALLRDNWKVIRDEAYQLLNDQQLRDAPRRNDIAFNAFFRRGWKRFYLKWYDEVLPSAHERCPRTVELLQSIPTVHAALFALLPAGARLGEHRDPFAGSLRYHLGLITPNSDECRIYVDGEMYAWRDGEDAIFDETFVHSARNDTDVDRVILFCDVERPLRTRAARAVNRFVIRHVVKVTAGNNEDEESIGAANRVAGLIYAAKDAGKRMKRARRTLYYTAKYALTALVVGLAIATCAA
jgi:beta-hydroxylase